MSDEVREFEAAADALLGRADTLRDVVRAHAAGECKPASVWSDIAGQGWFRIYLSEEFGGLGLGLAHLAAVFRAAGRRLVRGPLLDAAVTLPMLMPHAAPKLREKLDRALDGGEVVALAEGVPAPLGRGRGAIRLEGGRLVGSADLCAFAGAAQGFVVVGVAKGGSFVAFADREAAHIDERSSLDPSVSYGSVRFDSAIAPESVMLQGPEADLFLDRLRDVKRLMIGAEVSGVVETLLSMSVAFAKERKQFGKPIGSFQAIQHMLAALAARSSGLTNLSVATAEDADRNPARLHELGLKAKACANEVGRYAAEEALQVHGAIGFTEELPLHLFYRRILTHGGQYGETPSLLRELGSSLLQGGARVD